MQKDIVVLYDKNRPTILGRDLHEVLEIETPYHKWFPRMCEYGFTEGVDFWTFLSESTGGRPGNNHQMTIDMAKEICMIQRSDKGKMYRQYFLELERRWNSPEAVFQRALSYANQRMLELTQEVAVKDQQIAELQPKASYYDIVLACKDLISTSVIAKDYGKSAIWLNNYLHEKGVEYKQGKLWLLYQKYAEMGYTNTKTHTYTGTDGTQHSKVHTYWTQKGRLFIYSLLKADGILPVVEKK